MALFIALAVVIVGACAGSAWWWTTAKLSSAERTAVYDIEQAADFVALRLPSAVDARLSRDAVLGLLGLHLAFLRRVGMATYGGVDEIAMQAGSGGDVVVAGEDEAVDFVVHNQAAVDLDCETVDIVVVLELSHQYLDAIGAFGPSTALRDMS